jgi:NitT/TauT family transport system substrate-binding protein
MPLASGHAQGKPEQTSIEIVATRDTQTSAQLTIADSMGYLEDEGLDVTIHWVQSGGDVIQLLGSGTQYLSGGSTFTAVILAAQHVPVKVVAGLADISGTQGLVLGPGVKLASPLDLAGLKLAYTEGNPQTIILAKLAKTAGLDLSKVTLVNMQPSDGIVAASRGDVAGLLSFQPHLYRLASMGGSLYVTGNASWVSGTRQPLSFENAFLHLNSILLASDSWVAEKPNTIKAVLRAYARATDLLANDRPKAIELMLKRIPVDQPAMEAMLGQNNYRLAIDDAMAISINDLSDWALGMKRIPQPVAPASLIAPDLLRSIAPKLVTWHAPEATAK